MLAKDFLQRHVVIGQRVMALSESVHIKFRYKKEVLYYEGGEPLEILPRAVVAAPSLEVFKARLEGAPSNLV